MLRGICAAAVAAALIVFAADAFGQAVDDVIHLGAKIEGNVRAGEPATVGVLVPGGTAKLAVSIKIEKKSGLDPVLSVRLPDGTLLDEAALTALGAKVKVSSKAVKVKGVPAEESGIVKFILRGRDGTSGGYRLRAKGKPVKTLRAGGSVLDILESDHHVVAAPDNAFLTVTLQPAKGSTLAPSLQVLTGSGLALDLASFAKTKGAVTTLVDMPLPWFGDYTLRVGSASGVGDYTLKARVKGKKRRPDPDLPTAQAGKFGAATPGMSGAIRGLGSIDAAFRWEQVSGGRVTLAAPGQKETTFAAPDRRTTLAFQLVATVNGLASAPSLTIVEIDQPPVAVGGPSRTVETGSAVTLDGAASFDIDPEHALAYNWRQVSGTVANLADHDTPTPSFTAPSTAGVMLFELVVNDRLADSVPDRVVVAVGGALSVADAGRPVVIATDDSVFLSGLRSYEAPGKPPSDYAWTRVDADPSPITLAGGDAPWASFSTPRVAATYRIRLTVDGEGETSDEVAVIVVPGLENEGPRADGGGVATTPQGTGFVLTAGGSADPESAVLTHEWAQVSGPDAGLVGDGPDRTGNAPVGAPAVMRFLLMVHDGLKYGPPDLATVVSGAAPDPVADGGIDVSGAAGTSIVLSTADPQPLPEDRRVDFWSWEQLSGRDFHDVLAVDAGFDPAAREPVIAVPLDTLSSHTPNRALTFALRVTDDLGATSLEDLVTVELLDLPPNAVPAAVAEAPDYVRPATQVTLDGSRSRDTDGDPLAFTWTQTGGAIQVPLQNADQAIATFVAPGADNSLVFELAVDDGRGDTGSRQTASVTIHVNEAPVLDATVDPGWGPQGTVVTLDASGTDGVDADALTFLWEEVGLDVLPAGEIPVTLTDADTVTATFTMPAYNRLGYLTTAARTRTFRLTVTDDAGPALALTTEVTFVPNQAPTVTSVTATPNKIRYDGTTTSALQASPAGDPDGDALTYTWLIVLGPQFSPTYLGGSTTRNETFSVPTPTAVVPNTGGVYTIGTTASDGIVSSAQGRVKVLAYPSWKSDVYPILSTNCTAIGCHSGGVTVAPKGLDMTTIGGVNSNPTGTTPGAYEYLVPARAIHNDAANSLLRKKIDGTVTHFGGTLLASPHLIAIIRDWINPDNMGGSSNLSIGCEDN